MKKILLILLFCSFALMAQELKIEKYRSKFATEKEQTKYLDNINNKIDSLAKLEKIIINKELVKLFNDVQLSFVRTGKVIEILKKLLDRKVPANISYKRSLAVTAYAISDRSFIEEFKAIFGTTKDDQLYIISAKYLLRLDESETSKVLNQIEKRFENKDKRIAEFVKELKGISKKLPPIEDLLNHKFQANKTIIYSFQRKDRTYSGITIIKGPDGKLVKNDDDSMFYIRQMAVSASELPWYLRSGNTPQGIFSIVGAYISPTESIGPSPIVLTRSPFEVGPSIFYHKQNSYDSWKIEDYKHLLPESWMKYDEIYQSFYAGKLGRKLIVMHGSADNLDAYKHKPYFPLSPTMGCLSSKEIWNKKTGYCEESDQLKLMNAFYSTGMKKGFLVVVELDDKKENVNIKEIEKLLPRNLK